MCSAIHVQTSLTLRHHIHTYQISAAKKVKLIAQCEGLGRRLLCQHIPGVVNVNTCSVPSTVIEALWSPGE